MIFDEPFTWEYEGRSWQPDNYENKHYGPVTVREALEHSLNAATAHMAHDIGIETVRDLAIDLGIDEALPAYPAISLGGWEVSLLEIARVYGVFANGGVATEPISVADVVNRAGDTLERNRVTIRRVVSPADAFLITYLLRGVVEHGTARRVRWLGFDRPAAGKTGTTNDYNDAWFAGYTPDLLTVVWVGFDRGQSLGLPGSQAALPIWADFMKNALAGTPPVEFAVPEGITFVDVDPSSGLRAVRACREVVREAFLSGEEPHEDCHHSAEVPRF